MMTHTEAKIGYAQPKQSYEQGRPSYPKGAVTTLLHKINVTENSKVLEVGAGSGKFTKLLVSDFPNLTASEPVQGMIDQFSINLPKTPIYKASAESLPFPDQIFDSVVCAQAFHWFDSKEALIEFSRVLKKRGTLGFIWNTKDTSYEWVAQLEGLIDDYQGETPRYKTGQWKSAFSSNPQIFSPLEKEIFSYEHEGTKETIIQRVLSTSFIAALPNAEKEKVKEKAEHILSQYFTNSNKMIMPYITEIYWAKLI